MSWKERLARLFASRAFGCYLIGYGVAQLAAEHNTPGRRWHGLAFVVWGVVVSVLRLRQSSRRRSIESMRQEIADVRLHKGHVFRVEMANGDPLPAHEPVVCQRCDVHFTTWLNTKPAAPCLVTLKVAEEFLRHGGKIDVVDLVPKKDKA